MLSHCPPQTQTMALPTARPLLGSCGTPALGSLLFLLFSFGAYLMGLLARWGRPRGLGGQAPNKALPAPAFSLESCGGHVSAAVSAPRGDWSWRPSQGVMGLRTRWGCLWDGWSDRPSSRVSGKDVEGRAPWWSPDPCAWGTVMSRGTRA